MTLTDKKLPTRTLRTVFHVGSLDIADKSRQGESYEGSGLSVSLHPREWTSIARLGGYPCWTLSKATGSFLSFHQLGKAKRKALLQWGLDTGYAELCKQWAVSETDSESGENWMALYDTEEKAREDYDQKMEDPGSDATCVKADFPRATLKMVDRLGFKGTSVSVLSILATFWVEDHTDLDGVWWEDVLDVHGLSAPRGVISRKRLADWKKTESVKFGLTRLNFI